jgi:PAS domain S-box-containing protein
VTTTGHGLAVAGLSGELDTVMRGIVWHLMNLPGADGASLSTLNEELDLAHFAVCAGEDAALEGRTMPLSETLGDECLRHRDLTVLRATTGPEVSRCLTPGAGAIVLTPVEYDGKVRGILGVRSADADAFDRSDVDSIRMLTLGAAIALRNAELVERVAESERAYRALHAQGADAALVTDDEGRILDANEEAAALLGYSAAELRVLSSHELVADGETLVREGADRADRLFRGKDGRELRLEYSARVLEDGRTHLSLRDVTQRRRAEDRLRTNLGRLHAIVETQQEIAALELDFDAVTSAIVERAQRLCQGDGAAVQWFEGYDYVVTQAAGIAAGRVGDRVDRASSLSGLAALTKEVVSVPDTELDTRIGVESCRRMGARSVICAPLFRGGTAVGALSIVAASPNAFDELAVETTRMMAEFVSTVIRNADELEERARLNDELRTQGEIVEHMQTALWVWAPDEASGSFRLDYANAATVEVIGLSPADIVGRLLEEVLPAVPDRVGDLFRRVAATGEPFDVGEVEYADHRIAPSVFTMKVFPLAEGRVAVTSENVTGRRELEARLQQAQKMEAVGRLAGGVAHDFNNLLTAIAGYSEFLISGLQDDQLRRHAEEIKKASARAAALTGQLLAFSRRQVLQPRVLDLNAVVRDMDMMLRRLIGEDVELLTMLEPDLAAVLADPTQLEQVIVNLAVNARDAMPQGGSVTIATANVVLAGEPLVELLLTDTGVGMTEAERAQLFDPFFTTKVGGTGLGLATVYGVVEQSGGSIEVDSAPGEGSSFRILLPAVAEPAVQAPLDDDESPAAGTETVLLVEDELIVRRLLTEILESSGYTVLQAGDGPSALELIRRRSDPIDLLITDVVMPGMSGPEVAQRVVSLRPGTEVLYISGYTDSAIDHHGVLEPGIAFLQKPFSADELARKVRTMLDGEPASVD